MSSFLRYTTDLAFAIFVFALFFLSFWYSQYLDLILDIPRIVVIFRLFMLSFGAIWCISFALESTSGFVKELIKPPPKV